MKNTSKILALILVVMTLIMSLSALTASAAAETVTKVFDATTLTAAADKESVEAGDYDDFFSFAGSGSTKRWSSSNGVYAIEINKKSQSSIQFTIPEGATNAQAVVSYASTGSSNTSLLNVIDAAGTSVGEDQSVTGTSYVDATFTLSVGTYQVVAPSSDRGTRISKIVVTYDIDLCDHEGGTATCKDQAVCDLCGVPYGELSTEHSYADGACTVCGTPDPDACQHTNMAPATCTLPATCECGYTEGDPLGHDIVIDEAVAPTCTATGLSAGEHCSRCDDATVAQTEVAALGHTLTFVNTLPTAEAAGKTIADCSVCNEHFDFGEVNVMTPGTYTLDAKDLAGITSGSLFDGEVKVVADVFACHLSAKYRTDESEKSFTAPAWTSTHRMNFGGESGFCNNGEGEEAVKNGGLKNFVQITTTEAATISICWVCGDAGREIGVYDLNGELVAVTSENAAKNDVVYSTINLPAAGTYLIGSDCTNAVKAGGNYFFRIVVDVIAPHVHSWSDATCTEPSKCECGETQGEALGHDYAEGVCTRCKAVDPDYVAPQPPVEGGDEGGDEGEDNTGDVGTEVEMNFFQKIIAFIMNLINKLLAIFKK